jgi:hypothetical protein
LKSVKNDGNARGKEADVTSSPVGTFRLFRKVMSSLSGSTGKEP